MGGDKGRCINYGWDKGRCIHYGWVGTWVGVLIRGCGDKGREGVR